MSAQGNLSPLQFSDVPSERNEGDVHISDGQQVIGHLRWEHTIGPTITSVSVSPEYQRQGLATEMYHRASEAVGGPIGHGRQRTDAGDAWAQRVGGKLPDRIKAME
jgi:GNAT superfamily N-acetyltransferase